MPDQNTANETSGGPHRKPSVESPGEARGDEREPSKTAESGSGDDTNATEKLAQDIRSGERWLIGIGIATIVINSIIALIYYGQLGQMRHATEATQKAANAAEKAAITAENTFNLNKQYAADTLAEMKRGGTDTHELAVSSKKQAEATKKVARTSLIYASVAA